MSIIFEAKDNSQIHADINEFMKEGRPVRSNYYGLDQDERYEICKLKKTLLIRQVCVGFYRLCFMSQVEEELINSLNSLNGSVYVINIPVRNELGTWSDFINKIPFRQYSKYYRYNNIKIKEAWDTLKSYTNEDSLMEDKGYRLCDLASAAELDEVHTILTETFDPYTDYLPSKEKLLKIIENRCVYVNRMPNGSISGTVVFVYTGKKCYQNFWIDKSELGLYLMRKLYERMIEDSIPFTNLWVADWNKSVIKLHKMLGAVPDNIIDYTYILNNN